MLNSITWFLSILYGEENEFVGYSFQMFMHTVHRAHFLQHVAIAIVDAELSAATKVYIQQKEELKHG